MSRNNVRPLKIDQVQFGAKVGRHMLEFGRNPGSAADRLWLTQYINDIYIYKRHSVSGWDIFRPGRDLAERVQRQRSGVVLRQRKRRCSDRPLR